MVVISRCGDSGTEVDGVEDEARWMVVMVAIGYLVVRHLRVIMIQSFGLTLRSTRA